MSNPPPPSETDLSEELLARTFSLEERLGLWRDHPQLFDPSPEGDALLDAWQELLGPSPASFERRLRWDGLDRGTLRAVVGRFHRRTRGLRPSWWSLWTEILDEMPRGETEGGGAIAFAPFWRPFTRVAWRRLAASTEQALEIVDSRGRTSLLESLTTDLLRCGWRCLYEDFARYRGQSVSGNELFLLRIGSQRGLFEKFIASRLGEGRFELTRSYPCLARLLASRVGFWIAWAKGLILRLRQDRLLLERELGLEPSRLVEVDCRSSDPHDGGRRVAILGFESGQRVVYKPRGLSAESAFNGVIRAVGEGDLGLRALGVLDRGGYGWMQAVESQPAIGEEAQRSYLGRSGSLLALLHLLRFVDAHHENVLSAQDRPFLVDGETMLTPMLASGADDDLSWRIEHSVLRTGFLPGWYSDAGGENEDLSALGDGSVVRPGWSYRWSRVNEDSMELVRVERDAGSARSPWCLLDRASRADAVGSGFRAAYDQLAKILGRDELPGFVAGFDGVEGRFVPRSTPVYARIFQESTSPACMKHGLERSIRLDRLARPLLACERRPDLWPLLAEEREALFRGDIPRFTTRAEERAILVRGPSAEEPQRLAACTLPRSGREDLLATASRLGPEDLDLQLRLIEGSFLAMPDPVAIEVEASSPEPQRVRRADLDLLRSEALAIAESIAESAILDSRGDAHQIGMEALSSQPAYRMGLIGPSLYGGAAGIGLFLAAAAGAASSDRLRQRALSTLRPLARCLAQEGRFAAESFGIGAFDGVGGWIFAFVAAARLLEADELLDSALAAAALIDIERVAADSRFDLVSGSAGAICSLSALLEARDSARARESLGACAEHLVRHALPQTEGVAWKTLPEAPPLCGLAHGVAGICFALERAFEITGNRSYLETAATGLEYEASCRLDALGNWMDLRSPEAPTPLASWCHGAPGIALARARGLEIASLPGAREDLEIAIRTTRTTHLAAGHLCCGRAGLDEILYEVGHSIGEPSLVELARGRASHRAEEARRSGWKIRPRMPSRAYVPGFMSGLAGIGYGLLRMSGSTLPSVLSLTLNR